METRVYIITALIIITALVAGCLSAWQYYESQKTEAKNEVLQEENIERAKQLIDAQKQINTLQTETLKQVMGEGYLKIHVIWKGFNEFEIYAESMSSYPIFDTTIMIYDQECLDKCEKTQPNGKIKVMKACYDKCAKTSNEVRTIHPSSLTPMGKYKIPQGNDEMRLYFTIFSRHSTIAQYSIITRKNKNHYYRVYEVKAGNFIKLENEMNDNDDKFREAFKHFEQTIPLY
ncbi:hypothetical protein [Pareuzebyella sediminis]|uniref:hypothetical protein n=1 Tax=Pareuzebyella sediminis TaxID=2607998 RepID=UPI0011ED1AF1|nr:hypothetical protein [Pareuzebyella sediminis]